ncbi:MAG: Mov34/MPN/PAD-1 family protein, partial [Thermoplasmata archaeon]|nr:Mov34/MPN/PAD-1 family protein [Thermoplasmata archaeon]
MADPWKVALSARARQQIEDASSGAAPAEAVGALVGSRDSDARRIDVDEVVPLENAAGAETARSFLVRPRDALRLERQFREGRRSVLGYFHSHPGGPMEPSSEDVENA